jgi:hypothetical protein
MKSLQIKEFQAFRFLRPVKISKQDLKEKGESRMLIEIFQAHNPEILTDLTGLIY